MIAFPADRIDCSGGPSACWPWRVLRPIYEASWQRTLTPWAVVRHTCDNPRCCNPTHMIAGTHAMNVADRVERNRSAAGTRNGRNVLGPGEVLAIYSCGGSLAATAARFNVSKWTVRDIRSGRIWGWLTGQEKAA